MSVPLTTIGALSIVQNGGGILGERPPSLLTGGDAGPTIDTLGSKTLLAGDFIALVHTGAQFATCTFERVAAGSDVSDARFWWDLPDWRSFCSLIVKYDGFTSGSVSEQILFREKGGVVPGGGDFSTYFGFRDSGLNLSLTGGRGGRILSLGPTNTIAVACRGGQLAFLIQSTVNLVSPGGCSVRFGIWS